MLEDSDGASIQFPLAKRRQRLKQFARQNFRKSSKLALSPMTRDVRQARKWFASAGGNLDGIIAKRLDLEYQAGTRTGMQKIKPLKSADCVVGGFRYAANKR